MVETTAQTFSRDYSVKEEFMVEPKEFRSINLELWPSQRMGKA